jgi:NAD(P)H-dependent flavin oxidoreductase YrpB (nitropropane dioxygenase family)
MRSAAFRSSRRAESLTVAAWQPPSSWVPPGHGWGRVFSEATIHDDYRRRILQAAETDTFYGTLFDGGWPDAPHRTLRNSTVEAWEAAGSPGSGSRPGEEDAPAFRPDGTPIGRYASATPGAGMTGDTEPLSNWAGQGVGLVIRVQPAAEIVRELNDEAQRVLAERA